MKNWIYPVIHRSCKEELINVMHFCFVYLRAIYLPHHYSSKKERKWRIKGRGTSGQCCCSISAGQNPASLFLYSQSLALSINHFLSVHAKTSGVTHISSLFPHSHPFPSPSNTVFLPVYDFHLFLFAYYIFIRSFQLPTSTLLLHSTSYWKWNKV